MTCTEHSSYFLFCLIRWLVGSQALVEGQFSRSVLLFSFPSWNPGKYSAQTAGDRRWMNFQSAHHHQARMSLSWRKLLPISLSSLYLCCGFQPVYYFFVVCSVSLCDIVQLKKKYHYLCNKWLWYLILLKLFFLLSLPPSVAPILQLPSRWVLPSWSCLFLPTFLARLPPPLSLSLSLSRPPPPSPLSLSLSHTQIWDVHDFPMNWETAVHSNWRKSVSVLWCLNFKFIAEAIKLRSPEKPWVGEITINSLVQMWQDVRSMTRGTEIHKNTAKETKKNTCMISQG